MDLKSTLLLVGASACSFRLLNSVVRLPPSTVQPAPNKTWKWRNISTSLVHSLITGAGAVLCFHRHPHMVEDFICFYSPTSHGLVAVSTGYFIHDLLDMALNQPLKRSWELLLHHSVVISCFALAVTSRLYLGFAVVSLLVEINSVFLHIRQLMLLSGRRNRPDTGLRTPRPSLTYSVISWFNLGTFLLFRVCTLGWMTHWLAGHSEQMPRYVLMMGTAGLSLVSTMNMVLFYRLLRADVFTKASSDH
ncbi:TLC domain-containing protein 2-like [Mugil cephalus]|uniref:TLC domain-containing protein 2-like n=1 Tax=Mugil cephalus TaxID=48193 RepID=UPI001FB68A94|nr:TLC domain-containing protein 2-like [Mugil cephalus]